MFDSFQSVYKFNKSITEYITAVKLALTNLTYNKLRTFLSIMGIVVGVMAVILVLSAGLGVKKYVLSQMEGYGDDVIDVQVKVPDVSKTSAANAGGIGFGAAITTLKIKDIETLAKMDNVMGWYAIAMEQQTVSYQSENKRSFILGTTADYYKFDTLTKIDQGQFFTDEDDKSLSQVIVLGSKVKEDLFGQSEAVGQHVKIKGKSYKVIGVLQSRGSTGFFDFDTLAYIPLRTMQKKIQGIDYITEAVLKVNDANKADQIAAEMNFEMRRLHDISDPNKDDFAVTTMKEARDMISKVFSTLNFLLILLTSVSLIVGGVGITNVMYVAVAERTSEIGLRKAVGASAANIRHQFLFEAVVITFLGAVIGIILSAGLLILLSQIAAQMGYNLGTVISMPAIFLSAGFSVITGVVFGYYPAKKASKLTPMEALRR